MAWGALAGRYACAVNADGDVEALVSASRGSGEVAVATLPLDVPSRAPCGGVPAPAARPARRLRPAAPARDRRAPARRRGRLDRRREVDARQLAGGRAGEPSGCCGPRPPHRSSCTTPTTVGGSPTRESSRARPGHRPGHRRVPAGNRAAGRVDHPAPGMALLDAPDIDSVVAANRAIAASCSPPPTSGSSSRPPPAMPTRCPGTCCARRPTAGPPSRSSWTASPRSRRRDPPAPREHASRAGAAHRADLHGARDDAGCRGPAPPCRHGRLGAWLHALSSDARARQIVVGQTLRGAVESLSGRTAELVVASRDQHDAAVTLRRAVDESYEDARRRVADGMTDGTLLRGEVLARWQEFVGTGEFFRQVETTISRWRDKLTAVIKGAPPPAEGLGGPAERGGGAPALERRGRQLRGGSRLAAPPRRRAGAHPAS